MNIGGKEATVALGSTSQQTFQSGSVLGSAFSAVAGVLGKAGLDRHEVEMALRERDRAQTRAVADVGLTDLMGSADRALLTSQQTMTPGARGFTAGVADQLPASFDEFAKRVGIADDPTLMAEYKPRWEAFAQDHITKAFGLEVNESNRYVADVVLKSLDQSMANIHNQPDSFDTEFASITATIDKSDLPPIEKETLKTQAYNQLAGSLMTATSQLAAADQLPVRLPDGKDVVAPGLSPAARAFLNTTTSYEAGGDYGLRYDGKGGTRFTDFSDHPRVPVQRPDGRYSTAAGRYQFTASTWDATVKEMNEAGYNITDFSPVNQDRVAWYLAQKDFAAKTGKNLEQVLSTGTVADLEEVRTSLIGTWEGFGTQSAASTFVDRIMGGMTLGGTGHSEAPDPWTDPRFAGLPYADKMAGQQQGQAQVNAARQQQAAQAAAAAKARTEALLLDLAKGTPGAEAQAVKAVDTGWITDIEQVKRIDSATKQFRDDNKITFQVSMDLLDGKSLGLDRAKDLDTFYDKSHVFSGMQSLDPAARATFTDISVKQGQISPQALGLLQTQLSGANAKDRAYAMSIMADIYERNSAAFSNQSKDVQQQAVLANTLMKYVPSAELAGQKFGDMQTSEHSILAQNALDAFDKMFKDNGGAAFFETARKAFDAGGIMGYGSDGTTLPAPSAGALARFESNYMTLFRENLALTGDNKQAHTMTAAMMKDVWAPSPFNGQLMEASPLAPGVVKRASFLPAPLPGENPLALNGNLDWIEHTIEAQLGNPAGKVAIAADPQTLEDMKKLGYPTYRAFIYDENGLITEAPLRVNVQMTEPVIQRELMAPVVEHNNVQAAAAANREQVSAAWQSIKNTISEARTNLTGDYPSISGANVTYPSPAERNAAEQFRRSGMTPTGAIDFQRRQSQATNPDWLAQREALRAKAAEQQTAADTKAKQVSAAELRKAATWQLVRQHKAPSLAAAEHLYDISKIAEDRDVSIEEATKLYEGSK